MLNWLIHCGRALRFYDDEDGDVGFVFTHNFSLDNVRHVEHIENQTDDHTNVKIDFNTYYQDGSGKFEWRGALSDFATWKINSSRDINSIMSPSPITVGIEQGTAGVLEFERPQSFLSPAAGFSH